MAALLSGVALLACAKARVDSDATPSAASAVRSRPKQRPEAPSGTSATGPKAASSVKGSAKSAAHSPAEASSAGSSGACRIMRRTGTAVDSLGRQVRRGQALAGPPWIELSADTELHIKHTRSGRELTLQGPGRMLVCPAGQEQVVLGSGRVRTQAGAGVRPGAWVSVATPFGVVRYANARAELVVGELLDLQSHAGELRLLAPPDAEQTVQQGQGRQLGQALAFRDLGQRCESTNQRAAEYEAKLLAHRGPGLGELASAHVRALKEARASCLWAQAAALRELDGASLSRALAEVAPTLP